MTGVQTCALDRKSTRLNSSHTIISYAVFCLKKKINTINRREHIRMPDDVRDRRHLKADAGKGLKTDHVFFFNDPATPEIYTLSLPDALPIWRRHPRRHPRGHPGRRRVRGRVRRPDRGDRKSTRLNSSHTIISYAVFCLKKKNKCWMNTRMPFPKTLY